MLHGRVVHVDLTFDPGWGEKQMRNREREGKGDT